MPTILMAGLALSLGGPLLVQLACRRFHLDSASLPGRLSFWLFAAAALTLAAYGAGPEWTMRLGMRPLGWSGFFGAVIAVILSLFGAVCLQLLQRRRGIRNAEGAKLQQKILGLSAHYRLFVVVTAAVVEEILYRGYAIGIGQQVWGNLTIAFAVSLVVFVLAHFAHGLFQLLTIGWIALVISLLFVITGNLFACILAHFIIDALGVLVMPWLAVRQRLRRASQAT